MLFMEIILLHHNKIYKYINNFMLCLIKMILCEIKFIFGIPKLGISDNIVCVFQLEPIHIQL